MESSSTCPFIVLSWALRESESLRKLCEDMKEECLSWLSTYEDIDLNVLNKKPVVQLLSNPAIGYVTEYEIQIFDRFRGYWAMFAGFTKQDCQSPTDESQHVTYSQSADGQNAVLQFGDVMLSVNPGDTFTMSIDLLFNTVTALGKTEPLSLAPPLSFITYSFTDGVHFEIISVKRHLRHPKAKQRRIRK